MEGHAKDGICLLGHHKLGMEEGKDGPLRETWQTDGHRDGVPCTEDRETRQGYGEEQTKERDERERHRR